MGMKPLLTKEQETVVRTALGAVHGLRRELLATQREAGGTVDEWSSWIDWTCDQLMDVHSLVGRLIDMSELA